MRPGPIDTLGAIIRLLIFTLGAIGFIIVFSPLYYLNLPIFRHSPMLFSRFILKTFRIEIKTIGTPIDTGPGIVISNHTSYLDIPVMSALVPGYFIARSDVKSWPLFGMLSRLGNCLYIDRNPRLAQMQSLELTERLCDGDIMIFWPEATSSNGTRVIPFRSSLFAAAENVARTPHEGRRDIRIQPVTIHYATLDGIPIGRSLRPCYAWYGDMTLAPHLFTIAWLGRHKVTVVFHEPVSLTEHGDRKTLAGYCNGIISSEYSRRLAGRTA
ncbi:MAG: lysophospholipid acyltransferase family protein [Pseudomonadota bacterium]|nr:lysophospholipid acyltransferase family protein [Pseudomonadota bacterium]